MKSDATRDATDVERTMMLPMMHVLVPAAEEHIDIDDGAGADDGKLEVDHRDGDDDDVVVVAVEAHDAASNDEVVAEPEEYNDAPWVPSMARLWSQGRHVC